MIRKRYVDSDVMSNPRKYGYEECPDCNGYGSCFNDGNKRCRTCRGTGLVRIDSAQSERNNE